MSKIVDRTLDFLELFAQERRPLSLSEIARLLKIATSSCHDVLQALQDRGYIYELNPRGGYYPTLKLYDVAKTISDYDPVVIRADLLLRSLRDQIDESVLLAKVTGFQATYLLAFEPSHPLRFQARVGDPLSSLYATSGGKALLGGLSLTELAAFLETAHLQSFTSKTITKKADLLRDIVNSNSRGWFENHEESQEGVTTLSSRFSWINSTYLVTIAGPSSRLTPKLDKAQKLLLEACEKLSVTA